MDIMERIHEVQMTTESDTPFLHVSNMETPLTGIGNLAMALCLLSETMEEPHGTVVQELARNISDHVRSAETAYSYLFVRRSKRRGGRLVRRRPASSPSPCQRPPAAHRCRRYRSAPRVC